MNATELGRLLRESYENAEKGEKVTMIHLFGINHSSEIRECGVAEVIREAGIFSTYGTELGKGMKLAKYVTLRR